MPDTKPMPDTSPIELDCPGAPFSLSLPRRAGVDQDEEWVDVDYQGERRRIRLHDYAALYEIPGLYELVVYQTLKCRSPENVVGLLEAAVKRAGRAPAHLRILELGAGNGVVAEHLRRIGVREIVGLDIIPEAAEATLRDRPTVYDDYIVADVANLDPDDERRVQRLAPNCLVTVAALGFGDVPPEAFVAAFNHLPANGLLAMTIRDRFLSEEDESGFGRLIRSLIARESIVVEERRRYVHRMSLAGEKLFYEALVARKRRHARLR